MSSSNTGTSKLAIFSLILGVLSLCMGFLTGIPGIILGHIGIVKIGRSNGALGGTGLAIGGLITSYLGTIIGSFVLAGMALPVLSVISETGKMANTTSEMVAIHQAVVSYANANDGVTPSSLDDLVNGGYLTAEQLEVTLPSGDPTTVLYLTPSANLSELSATETMLRTAPSVDVGPDVMIKVDGTKQIDFE